MSEIPAAEPELPRALVLGYLTQTKTASRARAVTAIAILLLGIVNVVIGSWILISSGMQVYAAASDFAAIHGGTMTLADLKDGLEEMRQRWYWEWSYTMRAFRFLTSPEGRAGWALLFGLPGALQFLLSWFIWRRRPFACRVAWLMTLPLLLAILIVTAVVNSIALVWGLAIFGSHPAPEALLWLFTLPVGALLAALLKDLCGYLLWFARNPYSDKPKVDFISGRAKVE